MEGESVYLRGLLGLEFEHSELALAVLVLASSKVACLIVEGFAVLEASDLYGLAFEEVEAFAVGGHTGQLTHQVACRSEEGFRIFRKPTESRERQQFVVALVRTRVGYVYKGVVNWLHHRLAVLGLLGRRAELRVDFVADSDFIASEKVVRRARA